MGWTNNYGFGRYLTEDIVMQNANFMNSSGLLDAGYKLINLGDGWQNNFREANGSLMANMTRFPSGL